MQGSIVMTYRSGTSPDRYQNLLATLAWLATTPHHEVIVVEQDVLPTLATQLPFPNCRTVFVYNPGAFNKAWGMNVGVRYAQSPVLVFTDADLIVGGMLDQSIRYCQQHYSFVKPYRRLVDLTAEESVAIRAHGWHGYEWAAHPQDRTGIGEHLVMCGGLFVIRRDAYLHLGGWDERFVGWGGEDDAFSYAAQRARLSTLELDEAPAIHLWHPRNTPSTAGNPNYAANCALNARYRSYSDGELNRWAEVNRQVMGCPKKYEPMHESD